MPKNEFVYIHNNIEYPVIVTRKRMRSIRYVFKGGVFKVSAPYMFASEATIRKGLDKFADRLIKASQKPEGRGKDFIYILGDRVPLFESGTISFTSGEQIIYKSQDDLDKKLKKWFTGYLIQRTRYYESEMGIEKPYKVRVKNMSSRYGSNSMQTHAISYASVLMYYTSDVIDSVVVHELAHDKVKNHSKKFYDVVYKYCPDYKPLDKRLRKGIFHD